MLDTSKDEPNTFTPFGELMNLNAKYLLPFILAVVSKQNPKNNKTRHIYYAAPGLNTVLFGSILYNGVTDKFNYNYNRLTMPNHPFLDPFNRLPITGIQYLIINARDNTAILPMTLIYSKSHLNNNF